MTARRTAKTGKRLRSATFYGLTAILFISALQARRRAPPTVSIGDLRPSMAFSTVQLGGLLERAPRILSDGTVLLSIADATGSLAVFIDRAAAAELPSAGDWVEVTGVPGLDSGSGNSLRVSDPSAIRRLPDPPPVRISGQVLEVHAPPAGSRAPYRIVLARPAGRIELVHWFTPSKPVEAGDLIEAEGSFGFYRGRLQIRVQCPQDLRAAVHASCAPTPAGPRDR